MSEEGKVDTVVIDNGSYKFRAGFNDDDKPTTSVKTTFGYSKVDGYEYLLGREVLKGESLYKPYYVIHDWVVEDFEGLNKIWYYIYNNALHVSPDENPVLLIDNANNNNKIQRKKMQEMMFESFSVPYLYIQD